MRQWSWIKRIRKGDVLRSGSGALRIVRHVSHHGPSIPKTSVYFAIQRCSWTTRCYTVYTGNDLRQMKYSPTNGRMPLKTNMDKMIEKQFSRDFAKDCELHCCDVIGVA